MQPPDLLTAQEEKELAHLIELEIDTAIESKHLAEIVRDEEADSE